MLAHEEGFPVPPTAEEVSNSLEDAMSVILSRDPLIGIPALSFEKISR
jgi:hypothetical protein